MLFVVQTCVPDYRLLVFREWVRRSPDIRIVSGMDYFTPGLTTVAVGEPWWSAVRNRFLFGRRFLWQHGVLRQALVAETVVAEWNPRILDYYILIIIFKLTISH